MKKLISISILCIALGLAVGVYETQFVNYDDEQVNSYIDDFLSLMNIYSNDRAMADDSIKLLNDLLTFSIDNISQMRPSLSRVVFHFRLLSTLKACRTGINQLRDFQTAQRVQETITRCADGLMIVKAG